MKQEDVDRILICMAAIDKHRAFNESRLATIEAAVDKTSVKADLESERSASTIEMNLVMKSQGFVHPDGEGSVSAFSNWYEKVILEAYKEYRPIKGMCDWCGKAELKDQQCTKRFSIDGLLGCACTSDENSHYRWCLGEERRGITPDLCPVGHGYHRDEVNYIDPPAGIDFRWRV